FIMNAGATPAQISAFLVARRMKGETVAEITGAAITMRAKMEKINSTGDIIDVCGTGGDADKIKSSNKKGSLNISTAVAFVVAAGGVTVAKHGNKSVSSASGSADILTELGIDIKAPKEMLEEALNNIGICFMFAPIFHPAMRHVAPIRQELGIRTIFNLLGPIINPASPKRQLLGVYEQELLTKMAETLKALGSQKAWIVHGSDGMDEITITGKSHVAELKNNEINDFEIDPISYGIKYADKESLIGGSPAENAKELRLLFAGKKSAYFDVVILNSAAAFMVVDKVDSIENGLVLAEEIITSGKAKEKLAELVAISRKII
ncbi:MAG: anthranilate phosphoribosyltransferase, partial [Pseudomonadota bacterium]